MLTPSEKSVFSAVKDIGHKGIVSCLGIRVHKACLTHWLNLLAVLEIPTLGLVGEERQRLNSAHLLLDGALNILELILVLHLHGCLSLLFYLPFACLSLLGHLPVKLLDQGILFLYERPLLLLLQLPLLCCGSLELVKLFLKLQVLHNAGFLDLFSGQFLLQSSLSPH